MFIYLRGPSLVCGILYPHLLAEQIFFWPCGIIDASLEIVVSETEFRRTIFVAARSTLLRPENWLVNTEE